MRELIFSMIRFSGAITMFSVEQTQNLVMAPLDTHAALVQLCKTLDVMSETLAGKLDASKRAALDSMSNAQFDILDRTAGAANLDGVNLDTATELLNKTSESLSAILGGANGQKAGRAA
jgi:hypothetical protein